VTGSPVLTRYIGELSSRCGLILALYSRPHSSECAVSEHRAVITALAKGDAKRASALMDEHLQAVANRALIVAKPTKAREFRDVLAIYAEDTKPAARSGKRKQ